MLINDNLDGKIRKLLTMSRQLNAQLTFLNILCKWKPDSLTPQRVAYLKRIEILVESIKGLMLLVSEDEAFVLDRHLVNGIDWSRVTVEYGKKWGLEYGKSERTIICYQHNALNKIEEHIKSHSDKIDFSWLDDPLIHE